MVWSEDGQTSAILTTQARAVKGLLGSVGQVLMYILQTHTQNV